MLLAEAGILPDLGSDSCSLVAKWNALVFAARGKQCARK
jgi:hypothetical protein